MAFTYLAAKLGTGFRDSNGQPVRGYVTLQPTAPMHNGGSIVTGSTRYRVADDGTLLTLQRDGHVGPPALVAANDDGGTTPSGVAYGVEVSPITGQGWSYYAIVPAASPGGVVDLDALAPLAIAPPLFNTGGGGGTVSDATTSTKGVVALAGDLAGTAAAPSVPGLAAKADASALTSGLAGKAASVHTHAESDTTGLVSDLSTLTTAVAGKADSSALTSGLAGKAATSHAHAESDVTSLVADLAAKASAPNVQEFTSSGTWTKPAGCTLVEVMVVSGGGGGGSGRRGAAGSVRCGGGGGASGAVTLARLSAALLASTVSVTVGTGGGAGGAAVTANDTDGANGVVGFASSFGSHVRTAGGGVAGSGGTATTGAAGSANSGVGGSGTNLAGGAASGTGGQGGGAVGQSSGEAGARVLTPTGAAAGGGITSANAASNGGTGGTLDYLTNTQGQGGIVGGASPTSVGTAAGIGGGGGGGASSITAAAQAGAAGGNYGGGGGGGGASLNGNNSGAGGAGSPGYVRVIAW